MKYEIENFFFLRVLDRTTQNLALVVTSSKGLQSLQQHLYLSKSYIHMTRYAQPL